MLTRDEIVIIRKNRQKIIKEIKDTFRCAIYSYPDWCHTAFVARCCELGEQIKKFVEYDRNSSPGWNHTDEIGEALIQTVFDCEDIVVNIEGEKYDS